MLRAVHMGRVEFGALLVTAAVFGLQLRTLWPCLTMLGARPLTLLLFSDLQRGIPFIMKQHETQAASTL